MPMIIKMLQLLAIDVALIAVLALALSPLMLFKRAAFAVMKRNFLAYFSNPSGYVFLCLFVLVTTIAAFVPHEFFSANLANLDQLNKWLPLLMLLYIPTITMSIWAEERRQGTDELLLTLPADDFDIVVGKYLAAAAIFTASLLFSQLSNSAVLVALTLGDFDVGLLFTTYLGYWLIGLAMLSIGMVASFLTSNLTVGFVLGVLFNVPLVMAAKADWLISSNRWVDRVKHWSLAANFDDFGRGVISFSGVMYFLLLVVVGIYLSMVLVGRRHWLGGRDGHSMLGHYLVRALCLIVVALSANVVFSNFDLVRFDTTKGQVASLSPATRKLMKNLDADHPVRIEAYISANLPDEYMQTRHELISLLKEFQSLGGKQVEVVINDNIDPFGDAAQQAEERYGIKSQRVNTESRGTFKDDSVIMGAAFSCGLEKVVTPFFDTGIPIEYELVRSIATVARGERYTIGVVQTDANMMGGMTFSGMSPQSIPKRAIIGELEQQYTVEEVDPNGPIDTEKFDVLLLVQPSSLTPQQMPNVLAAIEAGVPTAIFEDPMPVFLRATPTGMPKPPQGMMGMGGPPPEKCNISVLWDALGLAVLGDRGLNPLYEPEIVWQEYNPYPQLGFSYMGPEFVYVCNKVPSPNGEAAVDGFSTTDPAVSGLEEVLYPFPGGIKRVTGTGLDFEKLCVTNGAISGAYPFNKFMENRGDLNKLKQDRGPVSGEKIIAARIQGKNKQNEPQKMADDKSADDKSAEAAKSEDKSKDAAADKKQRDGMHVVYVSDIDCLSDEFVSIRQRRDERLPFRFDNVTFVLNVLDSLAGDERFIPIRSRKLHYSTLQLVEQETQRIREDEKARNEQFNTEFEEALKKAKELSEKQYKEFEERQKAIQEKQDRGEAITLEDYTGITTQLEEQRKKAQEELEKESRRLQAKREKDVEKTRRDFQQSIQRIQNEFKAWAVVLPVLPPLLVGLVVFARRRLREREGVSRDRLR
jgi:ABC-2 type transport system permease protein